MDDNASNPVPETRPMDERIPFLERLRDLHAVNNELSRIEDVDDLFRDAVKQGCARLDFERLGILLLDREQCEIVNTFGIDEEGNLRDERGLHHSYLGDECMEKVLEHNMPFAVNTNGAIFNHRAESIGTGMRAIAGLWNGQDVVGFLSTDNLLTRRTIDEHDCEILSLYASSLGHLYSRLIAEKELRSKEEELRHAQKMEAVGRLAGGVAHDFNNLLTSILGFGMIVRDGLGPEHPLYTEMEELMLSAERATKLTNQLLTFGRKTIVHVRPLNINEAVAQMDHLLRRTLGRDIQLVSLLGEHLGYVVMDPGHLDQIIMNLAVNARDAMPEGGKLTISTQRVKVENGQLECPAGHYALLRVTDTGHGIPQDIQHDIFEAFFTTKETGKGTGLGLSIVAGIVEQCGGAVEVDSSSHGTQFSIYLPSIDSVGGDFIGKVERREMPRGTESVLVVEDEESVRRLTVRTLEDLGYATMQARHGGEAMRIFQTQQDQIDVIVTDVIMPHMGAFELMEEVRRLNPDMKVLYTSGFIDQEEFERHFTSRKARLLMKPYTRDALAHAVRLVLDAD